MNRRDRRKRMKYLIEAATGSPIDAEAQAKQRRFLLPLLLLILMAAAFVPVVAQNVEASSAPGSVGSVSVSRSDGSLTASWSAPFRARPSTTSPTAQTAAEAGASPRSITPAQASPSASTTPRPTSSASAPATITAGAVGPTPRPLAHTFPPTLNASSRPPRPHRSPSPAPTAP